MSFSCFLYIFMSFCVFYCYDVVLYTGTRFMWFSSFFVFFFFRLIAVRYSFPSSFIFNIIFVLLDFEYPILLVFIGFLPLVAALYVLFVFLIHFYVFLSLLLLWCRAVYRYQICVILQVCRVFLLSLNCNEIFFSFVFHI